MSLHRLSVFLLPGLALFQQQQMMLGTFSEHAFAAVWTFLISTWNTAAVRYRFIASGTDTTSASFTTLGVFLP